MSVEELTKESGNLIVQSPPSQVHRFHDGDVALDFGVYLESTGHQVKVDQVFPFKNSNQRISYTVKTSSRTISVPLEGSEDYHA